MACGHGVVVRGTVVRSNVLSHFTRWMHVPGMHGEHRRQGHLCPGHHDHKQRRLNGLLQHSVSVWQIKSCHDVTILTSKRDCNKVDAREDYPTRFSSAARNSRKRNA